jgi:16S rRNA processing protein RimM
MLLIVGRIVRPHGIVGEVVVDVRTDEPEQRFVPGSVLVTDPGRARAQPSASNSAAAQPSASNSASADIPAKLAIQTVRPHQGRLLVVFDGVHDRTAADNLRGVLLCVDSDNVPAPGDPDEFHDHQLIGLAAVTPGGEALGEIVRIEHAPASDLLVLRRPDGRTALVPFVKAIVPDVDLAGRRVVMTPPEGLFDL